ncbi:MAG: HEAT repeat domain-containing protein, partial [Deferrisomatales bacterium]
MRTVPRGQAAGAPAVREALKAPTEDGQIEGLLRVLLAEDLAAALEAQEALAGFGPRAVPRLASEMRRSRNNWLIGGTLVRMGSQAVGPLIELLDGAPEATVVDCIYLLGEIQDRRAVPTLVRLLDDRREKVRMYAVSALLEVGGQQAVDAVLARIPREAKDLQGFIGESLVRYGRKSVEPVIQSLTSADARSRQEAAYL